MFGVYLNKNTLLMTTVNEIFTFIKIRLQLTFITGPKLGFKPVKL